MHPHPEYETSEPAPKPSLPAVPPAGSPQEPVLTVGAVTVALTAILALIVTVVPISDAAQTQILILLGVLAPWIVAWVARSNAWAPATVTQVVAAERQKAIQDR